MARKLFQFRADNGSGNYQVQVVNCQSGAVLRTGGYTFDVTLTSQALNGIVHGFFDNVPVGLIIPAGTQLRTVDLSQPGSAKLGECSASPVVICSTNVQCDIKNFTHTASTTCVGGVKGLDVGFTVNETGDFLIQVIRYDTGVVLAQKTHTAQVVGAQTDSLPVPLTGLFPYAALYLKVTSAANPACSASDLTNFIRFDDTFTSVGQRWTKVNICASILKATCTGTFRVMAVDCTAGTVLNVQPPDWPVQFVAEADAAAYLTAQGYSLPVAVVVTPPVAVVVPPPVILPPPVIVTPPPPVIVTPPPAVVVPTPPAVAVPPAAICAIGTIRKVGIGSPVVYFLPVDQLFSGFPDTFTLLNGDGTTPAVPLGTLVQSQSDETVGGVVQRVRYLQLGITSTLAGTVNMRLRASNSAGAATLDFPVVTIVRSAWKLQNLALKVRSDLNGGLIVAANKALTGVFITPQGNCITETDTTPLTLPLVGGLEVPLTNQAELPIRKRGIYTLAMGDGALSESLTVTLPAGPGQYITDTRSAVVAAARVTLQGNYQSVPTAPAPPAPPNYVLTVEENNCDRVQFWIADKNNPATPATGIILVDGVERARVTATIDHAGVQNYLAGQGVVTNSLTFGAVWNKPESLHDGVAHTFDVIALDGTQATYNVAKSVTCALTPTTPVVRQRILIGPLSATEGGVAVEFHTRELMSDNTEHLYTGAATYAWKGVVPASVTLTPTVGTSKVEVQVPLGAISANVAATLEATYPDATKSQTEVQLVYGGCLRPTSGLARQPRFVWNYAPASTGVSRLFTSLDDAITTMENQFVNPTTGSFSDFVVQFTEYTNGATVYAGTGSDCTLASDNIYFAIGSDGLDTQHIAVQVVNGKIVAQKNSVPAASAPTYVGAAAVNVVFNTSRPSGPDIDFETLAKLVTVGVTNSNQSVSRSTAAATRFNGGSGIATANWLAAPQQSNKTVYTGQKYDSFAFSVGNLIAAYPTATTLAFDIIARRRADPVTATFNPDAALYRILQVQVSTNRTYGIVPVALNPVTGTDYDYNGPRQGSTTFAFMGDGVQGVLIPAATDVVLGRLTINLSTKTVSFVESIEPSPGAVPTIP